MYALTRRSFSLLKSKSTNMNNKYIVFYAHRLAWFNYCLWLQFHSFTCLGWDLWSLYNSSTPKTSKRSLDEYLTKHRFVSAAPHPVHPHYKCLRRRWSKGCLFQKLFLAASRTVHKVHISGWKVVRAQSQTITKWTQLCGRWPSIRRTGHYDQRPEPVTLFNFVSIDT